MTSRPEARVQELGLDLSGHPMAPGPLAAVIVSRDQAWVSGQPPSRDGTIVYTGQVGDGGLSIEDGYDAARLCVLNGLAALRSELGSLDVIERVVKVVGFVQSPPGFSLQSRVINGASELLVDVFGPEAGRHARSAIGVASLPGNMAVEVELVVELRTGDAT